MTNEALGFIGRHTSILDRNMAFITCLNRPDLLVKGMSIEVNPMPIIVQTVCGDDDILTSRGEIAEIIKYYGPGRKIFLNKYKLEQRIGVGNGVYINRWKEWAKQIEGLVRIDHFAETDVYSSDGLRREIIKQETPASVAIVRESGLLENIKAIDEKSINLAILRLKIHNALLPVA